MFTLLPGYPLGETSHKVRRGFALICKSEAEPGFYGKSGCGGPMKKRPGSHQSSAHMGGSGVQRARGRDPKGLMQPCSGWGGVFFQSIQVM